MGYFAREMYVPKALIFSLILHILLLVLFEKMPVPDRDISKPIEVEIRTDPKEKPFVLDAGVPQQIQKDESPDDKVRLQSQNKVRVKEQTQAQQIGLTKNRALSPAKAKKKTNDNSEPGKKPLDLNPQFAIPETRDLEQGVSSTNQLFNGVKVGSVTALNTDKHLYYTFYSRFENAFYNRWAPAVRSELEKYSNEYLMKQNWVTEFSCVLNSKGYFVNAVIIKSSGIKGLDQAAVEACKQSSPHLNPPQGIVRDDGLIHIDYRLTVLTRSEGF